MKTSYNDGTSEGLSKMNIQAQKPPKRPVITLEEVLALEAT